MTLHTGNPFTLDVKAVGDDGTFEGYASIFGLADLGRDVVSTGAFGKSLASRPAAKVKMFRQHRHDDPIGIWTDLVEDGKGLKAKGRLILDTTLGRETYALMKAGALDGLSIGFRVLKDTFDRTKGLRILQELDLVEISVVAFPMNKASTVTSVKAADQAERARAIVTAIDRARRALRT